MLEHLFLFIKTLVITWSVRKAREAVAAEKKLEEEIMLTIESIEAKIAKINNLSAK